MYTAVFANCVSIGIPMFRSLQRIRRGPRPRETFQDLKVVKCTIRMLSVAASRVLLSKMLVALHEVPACIRTQLQAINALQKACNLRFLRLCL
jgi:hypothetical protein